MDRISKLFGHKPRPPSGGADESLQNDTPGKEPSASQPVDSQITQVAHPVPGTAGQVYGLNFILDTGETKTFDSLPISIGRGEQNELVLNDPSVSTVHARVYYDEIIKDVCIVDDNSLNGLYIDNQPTRKNLLLDGAKIRFGNATLIFRDTGYIHSS